MSVLLYPPFLQWEVVSDCNHKCIHCYNYWRADNLPVDECTKFDEILNRIIERKPLYMAITGGEPMLVFSKVKGAIDKLTEAGIMVSISTNGTLITEEIAKYLSEKKVDLVISLPSIDPAVCDQVCGAHNVVRKLEDVFPLLKKYEINTSINVVINKLNMATLYATLAAIAKLGFVARVGVAQRPINASDEYLAYSLNKNDFNYIVEECIKAKTDFDLNLDFSVCLPDCAFNNPQDLDVLQKGDCFGGTLAYAIATNGDVKACQCDTKVYGNILIDDFETIYKNMVEWRDGSLVPDDCKNCIRLMTCRGGCRVESFANKDDYRSLPTFADVDNVSNEILQNDVLFDFSGQCFCVNEKAVFLQDKECYRVSVGITPTHLEKEFAEWLLANKEFTYSELLDNCDVDSEVLNVIINWLYANNVIVCVNANEKRFLR